MTMIFIEKKNEEVEMKPVVIFKSHIHTYVYIYIHKVNFEIFINFIFKNNQIFPKLSCSSALSIEIEILLNSVKFIYTHSL